MAQPLSHGIKHWHWKNKGVEPWAKKYWAEKLPGTEANGVVVEEVTDSEGDAEVGMRKSKLIFWYSQRITMKWKATSADGEEISGTLVAPEVEHDMDEDEYRFEATLTTGSGKEAEEFLRTAKKALADKLRPKFQQFPKDAIAHHGKDLLDDPSAASSPSASGASTPSTSAPAASSSAPSAAAAAASKPAAKPASLSTAIVRASGEFQTDAPTLFDFLTNKDKVPAWSRNPAQIEPKEGAEVVLFGGNIRGKVLKVEAPKVFSMSWRAPTWPEDHYGTLEMELNQGSNSTTLSLKLSGVPVGKEDETESNLHAFYIRGLQAIGLGLLSSPTSASSSTSSPSSSTSTSSRQKRASRPGQKQPKKSSAWNRYTFANVGAFAASFGLILGMGAALYYGPSGPGGKKA
ncbi:hypothetical protein JCM8097_005918 [Rhodosporidiobolus ruineniae]